MAFVPAMPYSRQSGELHIDLAARGPPPPIPYELSQAVPEEVFAQRMEAMRRCLMRYSWSKLERVYVFIAGALSFILPWPLMLLADDTYGHIDLSQNLAEPDGTDQFGNIILTPSQVHTLETARLITFGIIAGLLLLLWGPYSLFKSIGNRRRRALLASWTLADCSPPRPQAVHLQWGIRSCSTFRARAQISVLLPVMAWNGVSSFHPQAYLPEYIMAAEKGAFAPPEGPPPEVALNGYADEKV